MILRRLGNKKNISSDIVKYFPQHTYYIEPFFGAGGMFFNKPKAKYNIVNDLDSDVFNLFQVIINQKFELYEKLKLMPLHYDLFKYWKLNLEIDPIKKAMRFLFISNFTYLGKGGTLKFSLGDNSKKIMIDNLSKTFDFIEDVIFVNKDFRNFFLSYQLREDVMKCKVFIYCDPPYLGTSNNYSNSFTEQDSIDLFDCLQATGCKFAMSEFDNEFILNQAKKRGLNVITIGERRNLKNIRTEILITNYTNYSLFTL